MDKSKYGYVGLMTAIIKQAERDAVRRHDQDAMMFLESDWCENMRMIIDDFLNPKSKNTDTATRLC